MKKNSNSISKVEAKGIKMIQWLQKLVGKTEPEDRALSGWRSMGADAQKQTERAYRMMNGPVLK